jgi:hypothetical protein
MPYGLNAISFCDYELESLFDDERTSVFNEPKKYNYSKMNYLSHNTYTFLLLNRNAIINLIKQNRNALSYVCVSREHSL